MTSAIREAWGIHRISEPTPRPPTLKTKVAFNEAKLTRLIEKARMLRLSLVDLRERREELRMALSKLERWRAELDEAHCSLPATMDADINNRRAALQALEDQIAATQAEFEPAQALAGRLTEFAKEQLGWSPDRPQIVSPFEERTL